MIYYGSITIEGFGSVITPIKYKLSRTGLNKIEGKNGAGKTTITNALSWAAYGKLVKKKSSYVPWEHIQDENYIGTKVKLSFREGDHKYEIIRCNEYKGKILNKSGKNRLIILKDGAELLEKGLRNKDDYQKWIIRKLGYSFELFKSTILFAQHMDRLMKEDGPAKKKIFDEAFETTFVQRARDIVEERLDKDEKGLSEIQAKLDVLRAKRSGAKKLIKTIKQSIQNFNKDQLNKISVLEEEIAEIQSEIKGIKIPNYEKLLNRRGKLQKKIDTKLSTEEFKLNLEVNSVGDELEKLEVKIQGIKMSLAAPKKCDKCGAPIPKLKRIEYKNNRLSELRVANGNLQAVKERHEKLKNTYFEVTAKLKAQEQIETKIKEYDTKIKAAEEIVKKVGPLNNKILYHQDAIEKLKESKPPKNDLKKYQDQYKQISRRFMRVLSDKRSILKDIKIDRWLMKDPLSNSGLKAFIFDSMLSKVNNYLKNYTSIIGFGIRVYIDMHSANKDIKISILRGGGEVPYEDISRGQNQLVDIVVAFALNDTVNSIKPTNLLIIDELFESLDKDNVEVVSNIITKKAKNKALHLITHQSAFSPTNCYTTYLSLDDKLHTVVESSTANIPS